MQISKRLQAVADMVSWGSRLADVGTDHGYVPIFLVLENRIPSAVAMDINQGPLERARLHIRQYGLEKSVETRLSDGLAKLLPGEADSILIAGMGGMLTVRILEGGREILQGAKELILQPQSDIREVRLFLKKNGYRIEAENMVEEDGKFYPMMRAVREQGDFCEAQNTRKEREPGTVWEEQEPEHSCAVQKDGETKISCREPDQKDEGQEGRRRQYSPDREKFSRVFGPDVEELCLRYGPALLEQNHPVLLRYLEREYVQLETVRKKLSRESGPAAIRRLAEIEEDLRLNEAARALYAPGLCKS